MLPVGFLGFGSGGMAAVVGALIGVAGSLSIFAFRRAADRERLRRALRSEILSMSDSIDDAAHKLEIERPHEDLTIPQDSLVHTVFEENAGDIGLLSTGEVEAVTDFYSRVVIVRRQRRRIDEESPIPTGTAEEFRRQFIMLQNEMIAALDALESELYLPLGRRTTGIRKAEYERSDLELFPTEEVPVIDADAAGEPAEDTASPVDGGG